MPGLTAGENSALDSLLADVWGDPEAYAEAVFPWGRGPLAGHALRTWQRQYLRRVGQEIHERGFNGKDPVAPILMSSVTGHGTGKTALTAILVKFVHDTMPRSKGVVTANTSAQLSTKTWAELGKWHSMSLTKHRSSYHASRGNMALRHKLFPESWFVTAQTCAKENAESFQGQHAADSSSFYFFDEASAIPSAIWKAAYGGLTDGLPMFFCFGNGTRNSGEFYDTHHRDRSRWIRLQLDSRTVEGANVELFRKWEEQYGKGSDFFKVRVLGQFPSQASLQFIPTELVEWCMDEVTRVPERRDSLVYGVDVARFGDNESVISKMRSRHVWPLKYGSHRFQGVSTDRLADVVLDNAAQDKPDAIFIDGDGIGGGVVDILRRMRCPNVYEVHGASTQGIGPYCHNRRAQNYWNLREAMKAGLDLPPDEDLKADLTSIEFGYSLSTNKVLLESKENALKRGIQSPDLGDAVANMFTRPVIRRGPQGEFGGQPGRPGNVVTAVSPKWRD